MAAQLQPQASPLSPAPPSVEGIVAAQPKRLADLQEDVDTTDKKVSDINSKESGMKMPELQTVPPPTPQQTDPSKIWGSSAMLFAALGGLVTRRPFVTALNAASQVFKAYKQNDQEAATQAFQSWKIANENALKMADFQQKQYKEAMDGYEKDKTGVLAELRAKMVAFQDTTGVQMLDLHGIQGAQQHVLELKRLGLETERVQGDLEEKHEQHVALMSARSAQNELRQAQASKDPAKIAAAQKKFDGAMDDIHTINAAYGKGGSGSSASPLSDDDLKSMSEQYLAGDKSVLTGLGYGNAGAANRARLQDMIRKTAKAQGLSGGDIAAKMAEFQGITAGERTLSTTQARIGLGAAEIQKLEPQVLAASEQLKRTNYPSFNAAIQAAEHETGDPALKNLAVRLQGLKSAFSQVLTRGGVPTDSARATTDELFNTKDPAPVMKAAMKAMNDETGAIEKAPAIVRQQLREGISGDKENPKAPSVGTIEGGYRFKGGGPSNNAARGPAPAHIKGKSIWPEGDHWVYEDGTPVK